MLKLSFHQTDSEQMVRVASTLLFNALIQAGYPIVCLSDLAEKPQYGFTASASNQPVGPKFVRITDLKDGRIDWETVPYCECTQIDNYKLSSGDILFARTGATTGKTHLISDSNASMNDAVFASYLIRLRPKADIVSPEYLYSFFHSNAYWSQIIEEKQGSAQPNVNGQKLLTIQLPIVESHIQSVISTFLKIVRNRQNGSKEELPELPRPLDEQRRIVARIEALAGRVAEAQRLRAEIREQAHQMLQSVYHDLVDGVQYQRMKHVAPIIRRPVEVDMEHDYHELGIRSFGKGTFHKPPINGADLDSKRIFWIEPGDLLFSNVFSWEGAIAVVKPVDKGRVGSHRFISCVPKPGVATANFLCFHFLTPKGMMHIGDASPGGAGRNRTLGLTKLEEIEVPVPPYEKQLWFDSLIAKVAAISSAQSANQAELDALLPAILDKAFRGEL